MRADQLLVERGLAASRSQSQRLIASGVRWRVSGGDWKTVTKNGDELRETVELQLLDGAESRFVSRGGLKLDGAISRVALSVAGMRCLDVGQGQLHPRLRADARVVGIEQCNARDLDAEAVAAAGGGEAPFDLIVGDLSFISQTLVWPAIVPLLKPGGHLLMLVKPQFELQPAQIGKGGLVKDPASYAVVRERIEQACREHALALLDYFESPITGGDGNREFFVSARAAA